MAKYLFFGQSPGRRQHLYLSPSGVYLLNILQSVSYDVEHFSPLSYLECFEMNLRIKAIDCPRRFCFFC